MSTPLILSLKTICKLTGLPFQDGSQIYRSTNAQKDGKAIDDLEKQSESLSHKIYRLSAQSWFEKRRWAVSGTHIGMGGHQGIKRMADFAIEKNGKVKLIECLTDWTKKWVFLEKLALSQFCPVWFVHGPRKHRTVSCLGYHSVLIKSADPTYKKPIYLATISVKQNVELQKALSHIKKTPVRTINGYEIMLTLHSRHTCHIREMI